jgi:penicillin-binding protein 2
MIFRWRKSARNRPPAPPVTAGSQLVTFDRRALLLGAAQLTVGGLLVTRMGYITLVDGTRYELEAESNRVNLTLIPPRRGWIIDRYGKALADNRVALRVDVIPDRVNTSADQLIGRLRDLLVLDADAVERITDGIANGGAQPVEVATNLDEARFAAVSVNLPELPGVVPARGFVRNYPAGPSVAHLIGYVGAASAEEYQASRDPLLLTPGFKVGKDGLEKDFDQRLRGQPGARRAEVTARGRLVRELDTQSDMPGDMLQLTIDADLQDYAARRMGLESGSMVIIDTLTGGILALVSMPAFDPNSFTDGIGRLEWQMLNDDERIPLLNKAQRGLYPPGSTLKPMVAVALQQAGIDPEQRVSCPGGYRLGSRFFRCLGTHGSVDMRTAIAVSCNTYFYAMGHRVGFDAIAPVAHAFGLGEEFDLPGTSQRYGTVPDSAWKQRRFGQAWTASDTLNATIGQGYVSLNPLQLAVMTARIASGRKLAPSLLFTDVPPTADAMPYNPEFLAVAREGMNRVVNSGGGTGRGSALNLGEIRMAGKTGTAQVRGGARGSGRGGAWRSRDHGLFVCFAPVDDPRYAASVVIEHGMGGARAAAPIAKDVLTFLYDRQAAWTRLAALEAGWGGTPQQRLARRYAAVQAAASGAPVPAAAEGAAGADTSSPPAPDPAAGAAPAPAPQPAPPQNASPPPAPTDPANTPPPTSPGPTP